MSFTNTNRPKLPGAYINYSVAAPAPAVPPSQGSVVAIAGLHTWGPFESTVLVNSWDEFRGIYGDFTSELGNAVKGAFRGEGHSGRGGAGAVLVHRFGDDDAAKASVDLNNTTPAAAITLTAVYEGTKGNDLKVAIAEDPNNASNNLLQILDGTTVLESYSHVKTGITDLATAINDASQYVVASDVTSGTALSTSGSPFSFTGGDDGDTAVTGTEWTDVMAALDSERFGVFAPANLEDDTIQGSVAQWVTDKNAAGKRFMAVLGGPAAESYADAKSRASGYDDPQILCVGIGTITDDEQGAISTAQLAPRLAGVVAARGERKSLSFARLAGISGIVGGASKAEAEAGVDNGIITLARDTNPNWPVYVVKGVTSFTSVDALRPLSVYSNPKYVFTMCNLENEIGEFTRAPGIIGDLVVNDNTRGFLYGAIDTKLKARVPHAIQSDYTVAVTSAPPPSDSDDYVSLDIGLKFGRALDYVFLNITVQ